MLEIMAEYKGVVPMMMDRFFDPSQIDHPTKKSKEAWKEELILKCHHDKKGLFVPADNIRMMIVGSQQRVGAARILGSFIEKNKATQYVSFAEGCIWVLGLDDPQKCYIDPVRKTFDDYDERSFPLKAGGRQLTRRPIVKLPWSVKFKVQVTDDSYSGDKIRQFFEVAGLRCGMCAYGPTFGRCILSEWEVQK